MSQRFNKREFLFAVGMLLLILFPVGGIGLYYLLRPVPEPNQRFVVQVTSDATLELKGVAFASRASPGRSCWRANGEALPADTFVSSGGNWLGRHIFYLTLQQSKFENADQMSVKFRPKLNAGFGWSGGTAFKEDVDNLIQELKLTYSPKSGFWSTAAFDVLIASKGARVIETISSVDDEKVVLIAGQPVYVSIDESEDPTEGRGLKLEFGSSFPDTIRLSALMTDSLSGKSVLYSTGSGTQLHAEPGRRHFVRFQPRTATDFTAEITVREYELQVEFSNISLAPEDYKTPVISEVQPSKPKQ